MDKSISSLKQKNKPIFSAETLVFGIAEIVLFFYNTYRIHNFAGLSIMYDEFGYWANASRFAGMDWSGAMNGVAYYSFGYSFFLAPLFSLIESPEAMYRAALFLNALFVCGCFLISYTLAKRVVPSVNKYILILICFTISVYPAYTFQAKVTWTECLLFLLIWILTLCVFVLSDSPTYYMTVIISVLLAFVYTVHQRTLGVLIAGVIVMALLRLINKINNRQILIFVVCLSILLFASNVIKSDLYGSLYVSARETGGNDYGSAINKAISLLSIDGIYKILASLFGQVYYLGAATLLFFYYGMWSVLKKIITAIKSRKSGNVFNFGFLFLILSVFGTIGISVIAMAGSATTHHLIYGRYNEMIVGPVFLFGLISLIEETDKKKTAMFFLFSGLLQLGLSIFVRYHLITNHSGGTNLTVVPSLYRVAGSHNGHNTFYAFFFSIFFAGIILLLYIKFPKSKIALSFGALSIICAFSFISYPLITNRESVSKGIYKLEEIVKYVDMQKNSNIPVYYTGTTSKAQMQFIMKEKPFQWQFINVSEIEKLPPGDKILITNFALSNNIFNLLRNYDLEKFVSGSMLWRTAERPNQQKILLSLASLGTQNGIFNENTNTLTSDGKQGYLVYGPYAAVDKGQYLCEFEMTLLDHSQYELGNIDIASAGDSIEVVNINTGNFSANNTVKFSIPFSCMDTIPAAEFRVFTTKGTTMQVNMISIELVNENPVE